jgi:hypothetical protein
MKKDIPLPSASPSASRRLLACCGFAVCWLGAAVSGLQATVGDRPVKIVRVEQRGVDPGQARPELATQSANGRGTEPALEGRTVVEELWR